MLKSHLSTKIYFAKPDEGQQQNSVTATVNPWPFTKGTNKIKHSYVWVCIKTTL